jgi:hypothetical protein
MQRGGYRDDAQPVFQIVADPALYDSSSTTTAIPIDRRQRMSSRNRPTRYPTLLLAATVSALCAANAVAQDRRTPETTGSAIPSSVPQAPVGHRQPRAADIPADTPRNADDERQQQRDREIDRKLWICRGC